MLEPENPEEETQAKALEKQLRDDGIERCHPSSDVRRRALRKVVAATCTAVDRDYLETIVSILSDSKEEAVSAIWNGGIVNQLRAEHNITQSQVPNFMRLDFEEVSSALTVKWLESTNSSCRKSERSRNRELDTFGYRYRLGQQFLGWLKKVWRKKCVDIARQEKNGRKKEVQLPDNLLASTSERRLVGFREIAELAKWTELENYVLEQSVLGGRSNRDLGEELGHSPQWIGKVKESAIRKGKKGKASYESLH